MRNQHVACHACGDRADWMHSGRPLCSDCRDELRSGEIHAGNVEFFFERGFDPFLQHRLYHGDSPADELVGVLTGHPYDFDPE